MPWTPAQRAAAKAAESPAQREARRAKERARYHAKKKKKKPRGAADKTRALFSWARSSRRLDAPPPPPPPPIVGMVDSALTAPVPNVEALARREHYASAIDHLTSRIGWRGVPGLPPPQAVLWTAADSDVVRCHRLASGLLPEAVMRGDHVRRDRRWLRSLDSESARVALAALGELADWQSASPRERAGYLLGRIVAARRAVVT
jgi:hypothetical protein